MTNLSFTQEEFDRIVEGRLARFREGAAQELADVIAEASKVPEGETDWKAEVERIQAEIDRLTAETEKLNVTTELTKAGYTAEQIERLSKHVTEGRTTIEDLQRDIPPHGKQGQPKSGKWNPFSK